MLATPSSTGRCGMVAESIGSLYFVLYDGATERDTHPLLISSASRIRARTALPSSKPSPRISCSPATPMSRRSPWRRAVRKVAGARALCAAARPHEVVPGPTAGRRPMTIRPAAARCASTRGGGAADAAYDALPPARRPLRHGAARGRADASISTMPRPAGTRRCSTTRRGHPARWSIRRRMAPS